METGREQMERSFRNLLTRSSSPVTANTLLDLLNASEGIQYYISNIALNKTTFSEVAGLCNSVILCLEAQEGDTEHQLKPINGMHKDKCKYFPNIKQHIRFTWEHKIKHLHFVLNSLCAYK